MQVMPRNSPLEFFVYGHGFTTPEGHTRPPKRGITRPSMWRDHPKRQKQLAVYNDPGETYGGLTLAQHAAGYRDWSETGETFMSRLLYPFLHRIRYWVRRAREAARARPPVIQWRDASIFG